MKRGDMLISKKSHRVAIMRRTVFASSGLCAAVLIGYGVWNNSALRGSLDRNPISEYESSIVTETTVKSESTVNTTATTTVICTTAVDPKNTQTTASREHAHESTTSAEVVTATTRADSTTPYTESVIPESASTTEYHSVSSLYEITTTAAAEVPTEQPTTIPTNVPQSVSIEKISFGAENYSYSNLHHTLSADNIETVLGTLDLSADNNAVVYAIKDTPTETAIALKLEDSDDYTVFSNVFYRFTDSESGIRYTKLNEIISPELVDNFKINETLTETIEAAGIQISNNSEVFTLHGISPEAMVCVKYEGQEDFALYRNNDFIPETFGDYIVSLGLGKYADYTSAEYYDFSNGYRLLEYYDFDSIVSDYIFENTEAECVSKGELLPEQVIPKLNIICEMSDILSFEVGFGVSEKGYITTNLSGGGLAFNIGEEKSAELIAFVTENYPCNIKYESNENDIGTHTSISD